MNRLADETSPYLRQHRDNPVDWYPWGDEAFERAQAEDKPILLSVGYSACHWCHVMAHESFEDPAVAAVINDLFVNVKVDREERPDVDAVYMEAVQAMTGHGGWPMTVFLAPDGRPFFGGTYFPPQARGGLPSFLDLCRAVHETWNERRDDLLGQADDLTASLSRTALLESGEGMPGPEVLTDAVRSLQAQYDAEWGGFGKAPKFPQAMSHELLLNLHATGHSPGPEVLAMITNSLDAMASGGMYDHLGGGFARYSVDAFWMVPHFEKMLYDQALLARAYLHAWQVTGSAHYRQVLDETIDYVLRDLAHPSGGLFSAEDADSEGEEGLFYIWRPEEIRTACGDDTEAAEAAIAWYGVSASGNFEGSNILHRPVRGDLLRPEAVERARSLLFEARLQRVRPGLDDKVLTEWNGLFLATLAEAAAATGNVVWRDAALRLGGFLLARVRGANGRWMRSWQADGGARLLAYAQDYAALIDGFTRLGECTGQAMWLAEAATVADGLLELFWDEAHGGVFTSGHDAPALVARQKDLFDNASPSANSNAAVALARLGALTGERRHTNAAESIITLLAGPVSQHPTAFTHLLGAISFLQGPSAEVVVVGDRPDLVAVVHERYLPNTVLAWGETGTSPLWEGRQPNLAYVCEGFTCKQPASTPEELIAQLRL
ncbi:MAG: thioredoxin domain-containing protein [Actinobacteria bacterium]|nr:thioredoxin domain-containing protein [Actinomycetota bacterium]